MKNIFSCLIFISIFFLFGFLLGNQVFAQEECDPTTQTCPVTQNEHKERTADIELKNPLKSIGNEGNEKDVSVLVGLIIKSLMSFIGAIVLLFFVKGAFDWLTSQGNSEKIMQGTKTMAFSAVGALVVFSSYILTKFVLDLI